MHLAACSASGFISIMARWSSTLNKENRCRWEIAALTWLVRPILGPSRMTTKMTRRDALKLGTNAAVSAAVTPLLATEIKTPISSLSTAADGVAKASDSSPDICFLRAVDAAALIRQKKLSVREVMQAHLKQINRVNPKVNAIVTLIPEDQLMAQAAALRE